MTSEQEQEHEVEQASATTEPLATLDEDALSFQVIKGDAAGETLGKVTKAGMLYDVTFEGEGEGELQLVNKGQDERGSTVIATVRVVENLDGVARRAELSSELEARHLAKGDVLAVQGGDNGRVTVTIQRDA